MWIRTRGTVKLRAYLMQTYRLLGPDCVLWVLGLKWSLWLPGLVCEPGTLVSPRLCFLYYEGFFVFFNGLLSVNSVSHLPSTAWHAANSSVSSSSSSSANGEGPHLEGLACGCWTTNEKGLSRCSFLFLITKSKQTHLAQVFKISVISSEFSFTKLLLLFHDKQINKHLLALCQ